MLYDLGAETVSLVILLCASTTSSTPFCPVAFRPFQRPPGGRGRHLHHGFVHLLDRRLRVILSVLFGIVFQLGVVGIALAMVSDWGIKAAMIASATGTANGNSLK